MNWEAIARVLAGALGAIDSIMTNMAARNVADSRMKYAADALTAIGAIVEAVKKGDVDNLDPDEVQEELDRLISALDDNDDTADQAVADKFDTSE